MSVTVKPDILSFFRAVIRDDPDAMAELEGRLENDAWEGSQRFIASLCFVAIGRRIPVGPGRAAEVIKFVAEIRAGLDDGEPDVDVKMAEALIESKLRSTSVNYVENQEMVARIMFETIRHALSDENVSDAEVDAIFVEAFEVHDREWD